MKFIKNWLIGIIGLGVSVLGGYFCYDGDRIIHDYSQQLISYIKEGERSYNGEIELFLGLALVVIGVILMLISFGKYWNENIATPPRELDK